MPLPNVWSSNIELWAVACGFRPGAGFCRDVVVLAGQSVEDCSLCRTAMAAVLGSLPKRARLTLTWDQGGEMAQHDQLAEYFVEGI